MKFIKIILLTLVFLVATAATIGFLSPSHVRVERSLVMKAPREIVFTQVNILKNWKKWSPWYQMDSAMKMEYSKIPAGPGAGYKWSSTNEKVGSGDMTITFSTQDSITTAMNFMEHGIARAKFVFTKKDSSTKVTWTMDSDMGMNPIGRIFGLFMDKMLGPDFEKGLSNLKQVAEAVPTGPKKYRGYEVKEEDAMEKIYIVKKDSVAWNKVAEYYQNSLPEIYKAIKKAKLDTAGAGVGLFFKWDSITKTTLMAAGVPVKGNSKTKVKGFETVLIPPGMNLHITYHGGYSKMANAHFAMSDYINEKAFIQGSPVIEEYVADSSKEADSSKWITNIFYPVK